MAKRSWAEMNATLGAEAPAQASPAATQHQQRFPLAGSDTSAQREDDEGQDDADSRTVIGGAAPRLSRKITACTSCRKHKASTDPLCASLSAGSWLMSRADQMRRGHCRPTLSSLRQAWFRMRHD